jgi:aminopeptidase N
VLRESAKAIDLYSRLFSPYPRENLTIVEADFLDGMEYDGLFFLSRGFYNLFDNTPQNYLTAIAVHETAHQWWYAAIANNQALEPWLDEALCTYSELLFYEEYYPELINWWWEYRVNYYQPEGFINKSIYDYQGFVPYRNATYLQGAKFLQNLRDDLGDEVFFDFLSDYAKSLNNKISNESNFFQILGNYTDQDVKKNYPEYFSFVQ